MSDLNKLFVDSNEKEVATLGGDYLRNFLATGSLANGFCGVSDKRVYFKGKCYTKSGSHYKSTKEERIVDLKDITGTGFSKTKSFTLFILMIISIAWAVFSLVMCASAESLDQAIAWIMTFAPAIIFVVWYMLYNIRIFEISFAGGKIAFKASNYSEQEIQEFQKALRTAKDNYTEAPKVAVSASGADELKKYKELLDAGVISQAEFDDAKKKILG